MSGVPLTEETVCKLIGSVLPKSATKRGVAPSMNLRSDLGVDSVGLMSIVFVLEEQAGIDAFSHLDRFIQAQQVSDIIDIVRQS